MTQPPYGYGPVPPGGRPVPPPGYGQRPGYGPPPGYPQQPPGYAPRPAYGPPPGYGQRPAYPSQGGYRPPMPPPLPYGPPGQAPRPPRKSGGSKIAGVLLLIVAVVVAALVRNGFRMIDRDDRATGPSSGITYEEGTQGPAETGSNPLVTGPHTLIPTDCEYTRWSTDVEVARAFFDTAEQCLEGAWKPVLDQAGLPFTPPTVHVSASTQGIKTPCTGTTTDFAAFYCPANKSIYMPISQLQTDLFKDNWVVYLSVFAHEYAHHVQSVSGILRAANSERVDAGTRSARGLELSRRIELQAQCFNGMYLGASEDGGSLSSSQITVARRDAFGRGDGPTDARDHGTPENSGNWFEAGVDENLTTECNTFTAAASEVN